jgi:hypothetical protein
MKHKTFVILIFLALVLPFLAWAGGRSQSAETPVQDQPQPEPSHNNFIEAAVSTRNANLSQVNAQRSGASLQPITRPILEMIYQSGNDIKNIPFFISDSISLEYSKITQDLEITGDGEVILKEIAVQDRININKETMGSIIAVNYDAQGRMLLAISFDESDDTYPLVFREGDRDRIFYLIHYINNNERKLYYGEELYDLQTGESIPLLQIQFEEAQETRPSVRILRGRRMITQIAPGIETGTEAEAWDRELLDTGPVYE